MKLLFRINTAIRKEIYVYLPYNELLEHCKMPQIEWHDLCHPYSTLLAQHEGTLR